MAMQKGEQDSITIHAPDDWHLHVRDGAAMFSVIGHSAAVFKRAIVMPNLRPPVVTFVQVCEYRERILHALRHQGLDGKFEPLMTLYLTDSTKVADINDAKASGFVHAVKYYPAGATTNSENGVTDIEKVSGQLACMENIDLPLLVHGEVTDPDVDVFDREAVFIDRELRLKIVQRFPGLRVVLEHVTTREAVQYVGAAPSNIAATITAHHLLSNRNALFAGGIRPHHWCLPVLKREEHRKALLEAATSGNPAFFLGTDSAPHPKNGLPGKAKETSHGCAGIYTAPAALPLYAEAFDSVGALGKLEGFASHHGADFYRLPRNDDTVTLVRGAWEVPDEFPFGDGVAVSYRAGEMVQWKMQ